MIDLADIVLRLGGATLIGSAIGLNRDLHGKPIGVRTLGLVGLARAHTNRSDPQQRTIQRYNRLRFPHSVKARTVRGRPKSVT